MNKKQPFLIIALAVAVGVGIYMLVSSTATRTQIPDILSYYSWTIPVDELDKALLTDGRMTNKSCELIDHALEGYEAGSEDALRLAAYAQMRTKNGYPEETARRNLTEQIAAINVEEYSDTSVFKTLFQEAPWTMELVLEKYRGTEGYSARSVLKSIAENSSGLHSVSLP